MQLISIFFILLAIASTMARNEPFSDHIAPAGDNNANMPAQCRNRLNWAPCINNRGQQMQWDSPTPTACPCLDGEKGVSHPGTGPTQRAMDPAIASKFTDLTLVSGKGVPNFGTLVGFAFTDNTNEIFIVAKAGFVFRYNVDTKQLVQWLDISNQVHNAGDHGLLSVEVNKNFAANPHVYLVFAVTSLYGPNTDENAISYTRVIRVSQGSNGLGDLSTTRILVGQSKDDAPVICSSTHLGGGIAWGHDGSLFIVFGDGGHFETDVLDYGQPNSKFPYDAYCQTAFGASKAIGAFRSQSKDTLSGKLIRINPTTGEGICAGSGYSVLNPYCERNTSSVRSRIYAMGIRNPYSMNIRPLSPGETVEGPGTPYIGDVGLGSFEEINAAVRPGMNFGWPCWEGPKPMGGYRGNAMNNLNYNNPRLNRPFNDDGRAFSCPYVYANVSTDAPLFYWSRYTEQMQGLYGEQYQLNMGFVGNCVGGLSFYTGDSYPTQYKNDLFVLDYGASWIKTLDVTADRYERINSFSNYGTPIVSLEVNPKTKDICYLQMLAAEIHCISYSDSTPPVVKIDAAPLFGAAPLNVIFSMDGTYDPNGNSVTRATWDFGDGTSADFPNPSHTYNTAGTYVATLTVVGSLFTATRQITITVGRAAPSVIMTSPTSKAYHDYPLTGQIDLAASVRAYSDVTYYWDIIMIHVNHYHPGTQISTRSTLSLDAEAVSGSHTGLRFNFLALLTVTDAQGATAQSYVRLRPEGWYTSLGNAAPVPDLVVRGDFRAGQIVRFDASGSTDLDIDFLSYSWDFGDGYGIYDFKLADSHAITSHVYYQPGVYNVTLYVEDNFGAISKLYRRVEILAGNGWVKMPLIPPTPQLPPASFAQSTIPPTTSSTTSTSSTSATTSSASSTSTPPSTFSSSTSSAPSSDETSTVTSPAPSTTTTSSSDNSTQATSSSVRETVTDSENKESARPQEGSSARVAAGIMMTVFCLALIV